MKENPAENITIVPIAREHIAGFHACLDVVAREGRYLASTTAPPLEKARAFVEGNIERQVPQTIALDAGVVVGWCDISPKERAPFAHCGVLGMGVHPEYRGRRIGWRLLDATVQRAWERGLTRIELEVIVSNTAAIGLYSKYGFAVEGIERKALHLGDSYLDLMLMALLRQPA